jgi:mono/diheme cytochrome c family protein
MRNVKGAALGLASALALGAAAAALGADKEPGGKELYKEYCKPCHTSGSKAGEYTPMTLTQEQWERFFDKKVVSAHEKVVDKAHGEKKVLDVVSPEQIKKIRQFAIDHAADSESPATCG